MGGSLWALTIAGIVIGGSAAAVVAGWLVRRRSPQRQRARALAQIAHDYRRSRHAIAGHEPDYPEAEQRITVAELIARTAAEGRPAPPREDDTQPIRPQDQFFRRV